MPTTIPNIAYRQGIESFSCVRYVKPTIAALHSLRPTRRIQVRAFHELAERVLVRLDAARSEWRRAGQSCGSCAERVLGAPSVEPLPSGAHRDRLTVFAERVPLVEREDEEPALTSGEVGRSEQSA